MTNQFIDADPGIGPHNSVRAGTRRCPIPARHGLEQGCVQVIGPGDGRSLQLDSVPYGTHGRLRATVNHLLTSMQRQSTES